MSLQGTLAAVATVQIAYRGYRAPDLQMHPEAIGKKTYIVLLAFTKEHPQSQPTIRLSHSEEIAMHKVR